MKEINAILTTLGLSTTEATLYCAGLAYGPISVAELARKTRIKRPTIYHALETLTEKGLVAKKGTGRRLMFVMIAPDKLGSFVDRKIADLEAKRVAIAKIIPLLSISSSESLETTVVHYEGIEGVKTVVEEALYCKSRRWNILAPTKNFFSTFDTHYAEYFMSTRTSHNIIVRSLWEFDPSRRLLTTEEVQQRNPRFLPQAMHGKFTSVLILFDHKAAFIMSSESLSAILIDSKEVADMLQAMFEGLWSVSEEYSTRQKTK